MGTSARANGLAAPLSLNRDDEDERAAALTESERELCAFHDMKLAEAKRDEILAHYSIAQRVRDHRIVTVPEDLRESLERCGQRVGRHRTTFIRYASVAQRIKPDELTALLALEDARGFPINFWDLVQVTALGIEQRRLHLASGLDKRGLQRPPRRLQD